MSDKVYSSCGEIFNDEFACYDNGDTYWSGDKREIKPSELVNGNHVNTLFESMLESLYEEVGEVSDSFEMNMSEQDKLLEAIKGAVDEHLLLTCFAVDNIKEHVMSDDELSN